jgi:tetratricopeptide (TPR) repeat protein
MLLNSVRVSALIFGLCIVIFSVISIQAQTLNPRDTLNQYISELQKKPNDYALRARIINFAREMKPAPAIPPDAEKFSSNAETIFKNAKSMADYTAAAREYDKALLIAPWVADYYYNLGVLYEKAVKPQEAKNNYEYYLLAAPKARDAKDVRDHIAKLETEIKPGDKDKKRDEMMMLMVQKSPAGAWAMSFFIGAFTPFLGSGQYYAGSYATAAITTIVGFASSGCLIAGVIPDDKASESKKKEKKNLIIAGAVIFGAAWFFDWIYAPIATMKYNDNLKKKYSSSDVLIKPILSYAPYVINHSDQIDHVVTVGVIHQF